MKFLSYLQKPLIWIILLLLLVWMLLKELGQMRLETNRLNWNQSQILNTQKEIQLANGRIAAQTGVLSLKQAELKQLYPQLAKEIKVLGLRPRNAEWISHTAYADRLQFSSPLVDSTAKSLNASGTWDTFQYKTFQYQDAYYSIKGIANEQQQWLNISHQDTLIQLVYRKRKHRWLWIFSPFVLEQRIYFKNPNAHVSYSQSIKIIK